MLRKNAKQYIRKVNGYVASGLRLFFLTVSIFKDDLIVLK